MTTRVVEAQQRIVVLVGHSCAESGPPAFLCNADRVHRGKRRWRQQLAADVLYEWAVLLALGEDRLPFGVGEECIPALLALSHTVPSKHIGELLVALADQRCPEPGLADAMLLPDAQRVVLEAGEQRRQSA